jgi:hypothetical protein
LEKNFALRRWNMFEGIFLGSTGIILAVVFSAVVLDIVRGMKERYRSRQEALLGTRVALIELAKMIEGRSRLRGTYDH